MILSASRRTDIPAFYSEWLFNRLREEYVLVRNPMNVRQVSKISLSPDVVDGIVFWTKNPAPMLDRLSELEKYNYYFQFTLNAYGSDVEPNVPSKNDVVIPAFQRLSKEIGRNRVIWRYDPILLNEKYTMEYHCRYFRAMAAKLGDFTEKCTISFLDSYKHTAKNTRPLDLQEMSESMQRELARQLADIAKEYGLYIDTCAEEIDLSALKIAHACCIDKERLEKLGQCRLKVQKDRNQRSICGCVASIDIGAYNTCKHGCLYCYANYSASTVERNSVKHNPQSPLLFGEIEEGDTIVEREMKSWKLDSEYSRQESLF